MLNLFADSATFKCVLSSGFQVLHHTHCNSESKFGGFDTAEPTVNSKGGFDTAEPTVNSNPCYKHCQYNLKSLRQEVPGERIRQEVPGNSSVHEQSELQAWEKQRQEGKWAKAPWQCLRILGRSRLATRLAVVASLAGFVALGFMEMLSQYLQIKLQYGTFDLVSATTYLINP
jgi:hypothetical protein